MWEITASGRSLVLSMLVLLLLLALDAANVLFPAFAIVALGGDRSFLRKCIL
jgi:hypothetical protein